MRGFPSVTRRSAHANKSIWAVDASSSTVFAAGASGQLLCFDLSSMRLGRSIDVSGGWLNGVAIAERTGLVVASTSRGELIALDISTGAVQRRVQTGFWFNGVKNVLDQGPQSSFLVTTAEGEVLLWVPEEGQLLPFS